MKFQHRVAKVVKSVRGTLLYSESELASEAIKYIGRELNSQRAWELKGKVEALRLVKKEIFANGIDEGWWKP